MLRVRLASTTLACLLLTGCGGNGSEKSTRVEGKTLIVYAGLPRNGAAAEAGDAAARGMRRALTEAGGRAGGRRVRLIVLSSTRPEDTLWEPGTVEANAERATDDPRAIAYIGELDRGASALSLPVTNRAGLLQLSPADSLASLTRRPPGRPRAGPERYYPEGQRTFARLVPPDLLLARHLLALAGAEDPARRVAVLHGERIADRELASMLVSLARPEAPETVFDSVVDDDAKSDDFARIARDAAADRPDAVLYAGPGGFRAVGLLSALAAELPGVPVYGDGGLAADPVPVAAGQPVRAVTAILPGAARPPAGRRLLERLRAPTRGEALLGYQAMRDVLAAIESAGPDRSEVIRAARAGHRDRSVLGPYAFGASGDIAGPGFALMRVNGGAALERVLEP